ncbi:MAG: metal-dependent hydrolase [Acidimicrobiales bacterium]
MSIDASAPAIPARRITTRRIEFSFAEGQQQHFMNGDPAMSHVVAVLSALFPEGEDFFVRSVRNYRDRITDPELKKQVGGFIGQEAIHGREHRTFNNRLQAMGYPTRLIDRLVKYCFGYGGRILPKTHQLAVTAALEHYTATLAELLLGDSEARAEFGDQDLASDNALTLLLWHAIEESEHKSVAFDVFQSVSGRHRIRAATMDGVTIGFLLSVIAGTALSLLLDTHTYRHPIHTLRSVGRLRHSPWLRRDVVRRIRDYNRRDFHPDDHDATTLLAEWRSRLFGASGTLNGKLKTAS